MLKHEAMIDTCSRIDYERSRFFRCRVSRFKMPNGVPMIRIELEENRNGNMPFSRLLEKRVAITAGGHRSEINRVDRQRRGKF